MRRGESLLPGGPTLTGRREAPAVLLCSSSFPINGENRSSESGRNTAGANAAPPGGRAWSGGGFRVPAGQSACFVIACCPRPPATVASG